jgi:hypothetical protein
MSSNGESAYEAHVLATEDCFERAGDRDTVNPAVEIGQGIISALLAIAAAVREGNSGRGGQT